MPVLDVSTTRYNTFNSFKTYDKFNIDYVKVHLNDPTYSNYYRFNYWKGSEPATIYRTENFSEYNSLFPGSVNNSTYLLFYFVYPTQFTYDSIQYYSTDSTGMTNTGSYNTYYNLQSILVNGEYVGGTHLANPDASVNTIYYNGIYADVPLISSIYDVIAPSYPITYRPTNCSFPNAPTEATVGNTVVVPVTFPAGYGLVNESNIYVTNNGVVIPSTYSNGQLTFTMPDPS